MATLEEYQECCQIQEETWGAGFTERVPSAILLVSQKIGGVTAGAFGPDGRMLGFVFGMTGVRHGRLVHWSDMLAVREHARGHHIGDRLKSFQRDEVRAIGVETILWTFDPLVARNAHFNINRLGARAEEYVPDMYGSNTNSPLQGALPTDRLIVAWDVNTAPPSGANRQQKPDDSAPVVNPTCADGTPSVGALVDSPSVRIEIPVDIQKVHAEGGELAARWRATTRQAFVSYIDRGYRVRRFFRAANGSRPYYELTRAGAPR